MRMKNVNVNRHWYRYRFGAYLHGCIVIWYMVHGRGSYVVYIYVYRDTEMDAELTRTDTEETVIVL